LIYESDYNDDYSEYDNRSDGNHSSDDSELSVILNGEKYTVTKTSKKGAYDFNFLKDEEFLAKSEEARMKFIK
jgi:hypothetical protein